MSKPVKPKPVQEAPLFESDDPEVVLDQAGLPRELRGKRLTLAERLRMLIGQRDGLHIALRRYQGGLEQKPEARV